MTRGRIRSSVLPRARAAAKWLALAALLAIHGAAGAQDRAEAAGSRAAAPDRRAPIYDSAPLVVWNRRIAVFRAPFEAFTPAERAANAKRRIEAVPLDLLGAEVRAEPTSMNGVHGALVIGGNGPLFGLLDEDLDTLSGETLESASADATRRLREVFDARLEQRRPATLVRFAGLTIVALLVVIGVFVGESRLRRRLARPLDRSEPHPGPQTSGFDPRLLLFAIARVALVIGAWALRIVVVYVGLTFLLRQLPYTRPWGDRLRVLFLDILGDLAANTLEALPGLLTAIVVFALARLVTRGVNRFLLAVEDGRVTPSWLHAETVPATRRLVSALIWLCALVVAYPYLPGSDTPAFKGVSVFTGAIFTLGSSGIVNQLMSGLVLIYSRALKRGDLVQIGDTLGFVSDVGMLSTKLRTPRGEDVTIPNAVVIGNQVTNLIHAQLSTTVTIGYDAPWRQVHALLLRAAEQTAGLRRDPAPYVVQRGLSDFFVQYELRAHLQQPMERMKVLSVLHAQIQDVFNESGVQIMTPHYESQPESRVLARPDTQPPDREDPRNGESGRSEVAGAAP